MRLCLRSFRHRQLFDSGLESDEPFVGNSRTIPVILRDAEYGRCGGHIRPICLSLFVFLERGVTSFAFLRLFQRWHHDVDFGNACLVPSLTHGHEFHIFRTRFKDGTNVNYRDVVEENAERFPFVFDRIPIVHAAAPLPSVKSTFQRYRTGNNADFFGTPLF